MSLSNLLKNYKILLLIAVLALSTYFIFLRDGNPGTVDLNLGIEFAGGVRIPITLEKPVDAETMSAVVDTLKQRINKFGLSQAQVRPLGNNQVLVELPQAQVAVIKTVEGVLREQGKFEAVVDGKTALNSSHIIPSSIGGAQGEQVNPDGSWQLVFSVTGEGELHFAEVATGKQGSQVYMFLDRPQYATLLVSRALVPINTGVSAALHKEGDDIGLLYVEDATAGSLPKQGTLIIPDTLDKDQPTLYKEILAQGYSANVSSSKYLVKKSAEELTPEMTPGLDARVFTWKAIGLRSAPTLQVEPIRRAIITQYSITGAASGNTTEDLKENAVLQIKELKSVLTGGRLPVAASVGSFYNIAPSLGNQFLIYSLYGIGAAILLVGVIVMLYYRRFELVLPIVFTNVVEIFVLLSILGALGTLDLAAMAGVIALIGSGVDNQIVITDELLKKRGEDVSAKRRLKDAFFIVFTTAGVAFASMVPLMLSGIVEVTGFAVATLLGVILGVAVTRPAYGAIVEETVFHNDHHDPSHAHDPEKK